MIAASLTHAKEAQDMHHTKLVAVCLGLFTVMMTGIGSEMENRAIQGVKRTPHKYSHVTGMLAADAAADAEKIDIIRDNFKMFLILGGAFGGAVVCVVLRMALAEKTSPVTRPMIGAYFTVSLLSAVFLSPLILKRYLNSGPEECFCYSFLLAGVVWIAWEIAFALGTRMKKAAVDRGWIGVTQEIYGNRQDVTGVPVKPPPVTPPVPSGDKLS